LQALRCVDIVLPYHELDYISVCKEVKADIFVIGEDWGRKPHNIGVENYLNEQGKKTVQIKYNPRTSSTKIKQNVIAQFQRGQHIEQEIAQNSQHDPGY
ncbi:MAG: cytidylyltransferase, partial [Methylomarinum sp.]|nr:cytidylyltransferase [Methylomarinum sp.]